MKSVGRTAVLSQEDTTETETGRKEGKEGGKGDEREERREVGVGEGSHKPYEKEQHEGKESQEKQLIKQKKTENDSSFYGNFGF